MKQNSQNNRQTLGYQIQAANPFATAYRPELLDHLLEILENNHQMPDSSQLPVNIQANDILLEVTRCYSSCWTILNRPWEITLRNLKGMLVEAIQNQSKPNI